MIRVRAVDMHGYFVVVSGLPGSGKSTLAQLIASALALPLLDKDDILERLFESRGVGDIEWRRALSRESDCLFQMEASALSAAVLVSHWHLPGMQSSSGTPANWISQLAKRVVNVHCECSVEVAAERFIARKRHSGHLDRERSNAEVLSSFRGLASFGRLDVGPRIEVDTSRTLDLDAVLGEIRRALTFEAGNHENKSNWS